MEAYRRRFGRRLLELRKRRGWSAEDAAHEVGVSSKTWHNWESGKRNPYDSNKRRIAKAFGIDVEDLAVDLPSPLGLGSGLANANQLDQIEAKVNGLLALVGLLAERLMDPGELRELTEGELAELRREAQEALSQRMQAPPSPEGADEPGSEGQDDAPGHGASG